MQTHQPPSGDTSMPSNAHAHTTDTLGKFQVSSLGAKHLTNTLVAAHLTFISLIFAKCISTAAAGAHHDRIIRLRLFTYKSIRQRDVIQPRYKYCMHHVLSLSCALSLSLFLSCIFVVCQISANNSKPHDPLPCWPCADHYLKTLYK